MDFVSLFHLILAFLSTGRCYAQATEQSSASCFALCPPGYYKVGDCNDAAAPHRCDQCKNNTFTAINNSIEECQRCRTCGSHEVQTTPCTISSDSVCKCKNGYYSDNVDPSMRTCRPCNCQSCKVSTGPDRKGKCQFCQRKECLDVPDCKKNCAAIPTLTLSSTSDTPATTSTSTTKLMTSTTAAITAPVSNSTKTHAVNSTTHVNQMPWLIIMGVMVALLVLFWLLFFTRTHLRYPDSCPCWSANKDPELSAEELKLNERRSHQGSGPTTLTLNITEETPTMTLSQSPATPEHPAHSSPLRPDGEHKAARQDEPAEQWPAIVLYAIIKEVPLRRWKEFLRLLSVADQQLERVELEAGLGLGSMERQYQMLRLWSQRSTANLNDVFSALQYMDLSGCAQLLQESLEKLQWRPELKQSVTACRSHADHELSEERQDT